jgi:hypothetical protein
MPTADIRAHLRQLAQLLEALPAAAPGLTSLRTSQHLPAVDYDGAVDWNGIFDDGRSVVHAACGISSLVELSLWGPAFDGYISCRGLRRLTGLASLHLDLAHLKAELLPEELTSLHLEGLLRINEPHTRYTRDEYMEYDEACTTATCCRSSPRCAAWCWASPSPAWRSTWRRWCS